MTIDSQRSRLEQLAGTPAGDVGSVNHYAYLDALRGLAFLSVMAVHTHVHVMGLPQWCIQLFRLGNYGVQLFFILSALTLCLSMQSRSGMESNPIKAFAIRRFFRIAPMYWAALVFYLVFAGTGKTQFAPDGIGLAQVLTNLSFTHGWYPTTINSVVPGGWSIAVEMNFYLLFPFLYVWLRDLKRTLIAIAVTVPLSVGISVAVNYWLGAE